LNIGNGQTYTTGTAAKYMVTVISPNSCHGRDTILLSLAPLVHVSVNITASSNPFCAGMPVTFTAYATNEGTLPGYQWKVNGINAGPGNPVYSFSPSNGDIVSCVLNSSIPCTIGNPATSNSITMVENANVTVSVSISSSINPACAGTLVTYTATPTNGGTTPVYQWKVNGSIVGTTNPVYSYVPANGDVITGILTSNVACASGNPATSNAITVTVNQNLPVSISINASANPVCAGSQVTFTAVTINGGPVPFLQWKVNGANVGSNSSAYSYNPASGDLVTCILTSNAICPTGNPATSNTIVMTVNPVLPVSISISASVNPVCSGNPVTYTAAPINGGNTPLYQWKVNGYIVGTNSPAYSYNPISGDEIVCILTSSIACPTGNPAISNIININVVATPIVTFTRCNDSITTINAQPFKLKGGIPLNGTYSGPGVTNGVFSPAIAGTGSKTIIYTYSNAALCSESGTSTIIVMSTGVFICKNYLTDLRDNKVYPTVQIGSQCWMAANLNFGTGILSTLNQRDNCTIEKYCWNDNGLNCANYGGLYQWDELMQYSETEGIQGLCPPGWHIPTETDWNQLFSVYMNNGFAASPLLYSGYSGYNALIVGMNHENRTWNFNDFATLLWSSSSHGITKAWAHGMNYYDHSVSIYPSLRTNAFSVRCLKD
jgi:uncharacterized protein (TIGR02145 family)